MLSKDKSSCVLTEQKNFATVLGGTIRLSFHDTVTYNRFDGTGGPDGCVDFNSTVDNGGLAAVWSAKLNPGTPLALKEIQAMFSYAISKADFMALAANVAVWLADGPDIANRTNAVCTCIGVSCASPSADITSPCVAFHWGRKDSNRCVIDDTGRFPSSQLAHQMIIDVFMTRLGFDSQEVVALMGGHTVGRAVLSESHIGFTEAEGGTGLTGAFSDTPTVFDNDYFQLIAGIPWELSIHSTDGKTPFKPSTFQWSAPSPSRLMLNTDMALVWDVTPSPTNPLAVACGATILGGVTDLFAQCNESPFKPLVESYAMNQNKFFAVWVSAFTKLQELGWTKTGGKKGKIYDLSKDSLCQPIY